MRRRNPTLPVESRGTQGALQPVPAAHTGEALERLEMRTACVSSLLTTLIADHSHGSGPTRVLAHLTENEALPLMQYRYQILKYAYKLTASSTNWEQCLATPLWAAQRLAASYLRRHLCCV